MADLVVIHPDTGNIDIIRDRPHLPLPLIHACALAHREFNIEVIDLRVETNWQARVRAALRSSPLLVGLSVMSGLPTASAARVSRFVKAHSDVPVVWGGVHPTIAPAETLAHPAVDMVVVGDGEETLLELSRALSDGRRTALEDVDGLWWKRPGKSQPVINASRKPFVLDRTPRPPYHLVDVASYTQVYRGRRTLNIETTRGCVRQCRFCYHSAHPDLGTFRVLSEQHTLDRMRWLRDSYDIEGFFLVDDNFFLRRRRALRIAGELARLRKPVQWQIQGVDVSSMRELTATELSLLVRSRLARVSVGGDSGSARVLRYLHKNHTPAETEAANRHWSPYPIRTYYSFIAGFPGETQGEVAETIRLMFRLLEDNPHACVSPLYNFVPYPGTPIWDEVVRDHGFQPPRTLEEWGELDWDRVNMSYVPTDLRQQLNLFYWATLCMDHKFSDYAVPGWFRWVTRLYRPVARARLRHNFAHLPLETLAARLLQPAMNLARKLSMRGTSPG